MSPDSNTYQSRLEYQALYDPLTELPNRALLLDRLQIMISTSLRQTQPFTLELLSIDHLREINESLGHHNGDLVVKQIAKCLLKGFSESDTVAWLGGDEFALLLSETDEMLASRIAHKILEVLEPRYLIGRCRRRGKPETCELVKELGCDKAQGYYMSRPLTADQLIVWMETAEWAR